MTDIEIFVINQKMKLRESIFSEDVLFPTALFFKINEINASMIMPARVQDRI